MVTRLDPQRAGVEARIQLRPKPTISTTPDSPLAACQSHLHTCFRCRCPGLTRFSEVWRDVACAGPASYKALQAILIEGWGWGLGVGQLDADCREYLRPTEKRAVHPEKREMGRNQASPPTGTHHDPQAVSMRAEGRGQRAQGRCEEAGSASQLGGPDSVPALGCRHCLGYSPLPCIAEHLLFSF